MANPAAKSMAASKPVIAMMRRDEYDVVVISSGWPVPLPCPVRCSSMNNSNEVATTNTQPFAVLARAIDSGSLNTHLTAWSEKRIHSAAKTA
jgi:hypothetical protein